MALRGLLTIFSLTFLLLAAPATAAADELSPVKILPFAALMKLPRPQQVSYIRGVRAIMVDLQQVQKDAHRSASARRRTNAQIVLLEAFLEKAEAADWMTALSAQKCPDELLNKPHLRAHRLAGALLTCSQGPLPKNPKCPTGQTKLGMIGLKLVCFDQRREDFAKYQTLRAKISKLKPEGPRVVSTKAARILRNVSPVKSLAAASTSDAEKSHARSTKTKSKVSVVQADAETPSQKVPEPAGDSTVSEPQKITSTPGNNAPDQIRDRASNPAYNRFITSVASGTSGMDSRSKGESFTAASSAERQKLLQSMQKSTYELDSIDEATDDQFSQDVVALEKDDEDDLHWSRRKISNFQTNLGEKKMEAAQTSDDLCKSPPPLKPETCTAESKNTAEKALLASKKAVHCFSEGGMISHFNREQRDENGHLACAPASEFCLNTITCRKHDDDYVNGAQVLLHCNSNQVICNPYLFNVDNDQKPFCVSKTLEPSAILQACADLSDADKNRPTFVLNTSAPNGTIEGWNEFADEFNKLCFASENKQSQFYCRECAFLKNRIWKLNAATLESVHTNADGTKTTAKADLCSMMSKLEMNSSTHDVQRSTGRKQ